MRLWRSKGCCIQTYGISKRLGSFDLDRIVFGRGAQFLISINFFFLLFVETAILQGLFIPFYVLLSGIHSTIGVSRVARNGDGLYVCFCVLYRKE